MGIHLVPPLYEIIINGQPYVFHPDKHPEVSSVDGRASHDAGLVGDTWANLRVAAGTEASDIGADLAVVYMSCGSAANSYSVIVRGLFLFDTSRIPDIAEILAATFSLRGTGKVDTNGWLPDINVYSSNPASDTALIPGDYATLGVIAFCDNAIRYNSWSITGYNNFALNAAGIAAINKQGITKFGVKNSNYDAGNNLPAWVDTGGLDAYQLTCYCSEQGAGYKPTLTVSYRL